MAQDKGVFGYWLCEEHRAPRLVVQVGLEDRDGHKQIELQHENSLRCAVVFGGLGALHRTASRSSGDANGAIRSEAQAMGRGRRATSRDRLDGDCSIQCR
jgi:hypothetical protein